jgi:hypothetical protein
VRTDLVQYEEHEQARVREIGQPQAAIRQREQRYRDEDDHVLQQPVLPVPRRDREREPDERERRQQDQRIPVFLADHHDGSSDRHSLLP